MKEKVTIALTICRRLCLLALFLIAVPYWEEGGEQLAGVAAGLLMFDFMTDND